MNLENIKKILVLQQRQIGDVLLTTPALKLLKQRFPNAQIDFFTEVKCEALLRHNPNIDNFILLDKSKLKNLWQEYKFYKEIANKDYDLIINFQNLPRCFNICFLSKCPIKIAPKGAWYRKVAYTHTYPISKDYAAATKVQFLADLGIKYNNELPEIYLQEKEINIAKIMLKELGLKPEHKLITLDTTHRREKRRYPPEKFAKVVDLLYEKDNNFRFFILKAPDEDEQINEFLEHIEHKEMLIVPDTALNIRLNAAVIGLANMHLGNLSAPHHIAEALHTPYLTIRGENTSEWNYPSPKNLCLALEMDCRPCTHKKCADIKCLNNIQPEYVVQKFLEHYSKNSKPSLAF